MRRAIAYIYASTVVLTTAACAGGEQATEDVAPEAAPVETTTVTVRIVEPEEGAEVGSTVKIVLETSGIEIAPISPPVDGTGHHHLYVDVDLTPFTEMIPQGNPQIIHKGDGSTEHTLEGLAPGPHRVIAVLADPLHVPISPPAADTVNFVVTGGS